MTSTRHAAGLRIRIFCLFLSYLVLVTLVAPLGARNARAARPGDVRAANAPPAPPAPHREGEIIVRFRAGVSEQDRAAAIQSKGARSARRLRGASRLEKLTLERGRDAAAAAAELREHPAVELVEPNFIITKSQATPDDARFPEQWALRNEGQNGGSSGSDIEAPSAWHATAGAQSTVIAVVDSGVDFTHPDLTNNRWTNPAERANNRDDDRNGYTNDLHGWDFVADSGEIRDGDGHGTAVAGVIAAEGNNQTGVAGVMWRASLMSLRVLDHAGAGDVAAAVEAIDYAVANGAHVVNCSWGTSEPSAALRDAIRRAAGRGVVVVASAGNGALDLDATGYYPAAFDLPNLISVAATDSRDQLAGWSNRGAARVHVAAPGAEILTTKMGGGYHAPSGSSLAAPFVAGVAGIIKTQRPSVRADALREVIVASARAVSGLSGKVAAGGVVSAGRSLAALASVPPERDMRDENGNGIDDEFEGHTGGGGREGNPGQGGEGPRDDKEKGVRPQPGAPGDGLPNLDEVRKLRNANPRAAERIESNICYDCDPCPGCGGDYNEPPVSVPGGPYSGQTGQAIAFDGGGSYDPDGWINSYHWNFGDGTTGSGFAPSKSYSSAGTYTVSLTVSDNGWQSSTDYTTVTISAPPPAATNNAAYVSQSAPSTLLTGQVVSVSVTMQNTGTTTWTTAEGYKLGSQNPQDNGTWGTGGRVALPHSVAPGGQVTFNFSVTAPSTPGTYNFQWRMLREHVEWFGGYTANVAVNVSSPPSTGGGYAGANLTVARLDAGNRTGASDLFSGNHSWGVPIAGLAGRSGHDLRLALNYNSLVWTRHGSAVTFDADRGFPGPGFRLGFPVVEPRHHNEVTGRYGYLLITPSGARVELRQVGGTNVYESADSSYLQLIDYGSHLLARTTDGTQFSYTAVNNRWVCTQIKDRNGNYISAAYHASGVVGSITDTLGRTLSFNYDGYGRLYSITQTWNRAGFNETHEWARFYYGAPVLSPAFSGLTVNGPQNVAVNVLTQVALADGTSYVFEYNPYGQVNVIRRYGSDGRQRNYIAYGFYAGGADVPRVTERRDWAENWNGGQEAVTSFGDEGNGIKTVTMPDRATVQKETHAVSGWGRGLVYATETWSGGIRQKWTATAWTQDDQNLNYPLNPRPFDTNVYDAAGNRRRTFVEYTSFGLPANVREYAADGFTVLRRTETSYRWDAAYIDRRIIGLTAVQQVFQGEGVLVSKLENAYDWTDAQSFNGQAPSVGHDTGNYGAGFVAGRGNLTGVLRYNVFAPSDPGQAVWVQRLGYNAAGSVVAERNALNHTTAISYADSYSDGGNGRNTLAYPTSVTDPGGYAATKLFNYDMGVPIRSQDPKGAHTTAAYDTAGRVERVTNGVNNSYTRFVYGPGGDWAQQFTAVESGLPESYAITVFDGAGRVRATAGDHPGSAGGYRGQFIYYDVMGRVSSRTNPAEITAAWAPHGDDAAGWLLTHYAYDWKGRPTRTTNTDSTYSEISYGGCGCAGGETITTTDEVGRRQRVTNDTLGRAVKVEEFNQNGSIYRTTTNTYNARDQVTQTQVQDAASGAAQLTTADYDGHSRLWKRKTPIQLAPTVFEYHADDKPYRVTDARGASATYAYNSRGLVTNIAYYAPGGVEPTAAVAFDYDAAGNRLWMTDGSGRTDYQYNQLSQLERETRQFAGYPGSYWLAYEYNLAGRLKSITDYNNSRLTYAYDTAGRLTAVNASGYGSVTQFASGMSYRASGALKAMTYGNGVHAQLSYNSRLLPTRYDVSGLQYYHGQPPAASGSTYTYYADGKIRYAQDIGDGRFDRAYEYDHVGRLKEAFSGREARGGAPTSDRPFRQSYAYDVFNNMTARTGYHWSGGASDSASYVNNRRQGWGYDASGNITADTWEHAYDAAGLKVRSRKEGFEGSATYPQFDYYITTIDQMYDGDGRVVIRSERRQHENEEGVQPEQLTTTYYLRSTVLGGEVAKEVSGRSHIYAGGQKIAEHWEGATSPQWWHVNPKTGSWVEAWNTVGRRREMDPLGSDVGDTDPYIFYSNPSYLDIGDLFLEGGDPFDLGGGCRLDGMPISCSELNHRMDMGLVAVEYLVPQRDRRSPQLVPQGGSRREPPQTRLRPVQMPIVSMGLGIFMTAAPVRTVDNEGPSLDWRQLVFHFAPPQVRNDCQTFADRVDQIADRLARLRNWHLYSSDTLQSVTSPLIQEFMNELATTFTEFTAATSGAVLGATRGWDGYVNQNFETYRDEGFKREFWDREEGGSVNQVRHSVGGLVAGYVSFIGDNVAGRTVMNWWRERKSPPASKAADVALNKLTMPMGEKLAEPDGLRHAQMLGTWIRNNLCEMVRR